MQSSKLARYENLILKFQDYRFSDPGLSNPHELDKSFHKLNVLSPWELWHNSLDASIMLIGQDFSNEAYFLTKRDEKGWLPDKTDEQLRALFNILGMGDIGRPYTQKGMPLFFTNSILGIKKGGKAKSIKAKWYQQTAKEYLVELINIVQPKHIITLGQTPYKAISHAYDQKPIVKMNEMIDNNGNHPKIYTGATYNTHLYTVAHCSGLGKKNRPITQQEKDWETIKVLMAKS